MIRRRLAALIAIVLFLLAPGLPAYRAAAQVMAVEGGAAMPDVSPVRDLALGAPLSFRNGLGLHADNAWNAPRSLRLSNLSAAAARGVALRSSGILTRAIGPAAAAPASNLQFLPGTSGLRPDRSVSRIGVTGFVDAPQGQQGRGASTGSYSKNPYRSVRAAVAGAAGGSAFGSSLRADKESQDLAYDGTSRREAVAVGDAAGQENGDAVAAKGLEPAEQKPGAAEQGNGDVRATQEPELAGRKPAAAAEKGGPDVPGKASAVLAPSKDAGVADGQSEPPAPAAAPTPPTATAPSSGKTTLPRSLWALFWGHDVLTASFGIEFHMVSQPFLILNTLRKSKAIQGLVRNVHMGSMGLANLLPVGLLIDKTNFRTIFVVTTIARALLMGAIPMLWMAHHLSFAVVVAIFAINPLFQNTMVNADAAARYVSLGTDEKLNKEAAAVLGKYSSLIGIVSPIIAGYGVGLLVHLFGGGGYALAYGVYSIMLLAGLPFYLAFKDPRDPSTLGRNGCRECMRESLKLFRSVGKGLLWSPYYIGRGLYYIGRWLLRLIFRRASKTPKPVVAEPGSKTGFKTGFFERIARSMDGHEALSGVAYILRNRVLRLLLIAGSIEAFLADAMPMVVLPAFITEVIGEPASISTLIGTSLGTAGVVFGAAAVAIGIFVLAMKKSKGFREWWGKTSSWLSGLSSVLGRLSASISRWSSGKAGGWRLVIAGLLAAATSGALVFYPSSVSMLFATAGGVFGVLVSAEQVGHFLGSWQMEGDRGDALIAKWGLGRFYKIAAVATLSFWLIWLAPAVLGPGHFWAVLAAVGASQLIVALAHAPVGVVMAPVTRKEMPDAILGRVETSFNMVDTLFEALGALAAGVLLDLLNIKTAMLVMSIVVSSTGVLDWLTPRWIANAQKAQAGAAAAPVVQTSVKP